MKISLVQALLHLLYTGRVVTMEGQLYSLMKLVYALSINASIEADPTPDTPTTFHTEVVTLTGSAATEPPPAPCSCGAQVAGDTAAKFDIDSENNLLNSVSLNKVMLKLITIVTHTHMLMFKCYT